MLTTNQTADKVESVKLVTATIAAAGTTVTTAADPEVVGGKIVGVYPASWAADAVIEIATIASDGAVTVTLTWASTAEVGYAVSVLRATGNNA